MSTLAVMGTSSGAGASTLTAMTFMGMRDRPRGAPTVLVEGPHGLAERIDDEVPSVDPVTTLWDAGTGDARSVAAVLEHPETSVALATPATPLGLRDARTIVTASVERFGEQIRTRICLAVIDVYRTGHGSRYRAGPSGVALARIPYDPLLDAPGPVPTTDALGKRTRTALQTWVQLAGGALPHD